MLKEIQLAGSVRTPRSESFTGTGGAQEHPRKHCKITRLHPAEAFAKLYDLPRSERQTRIRAAMGFMGPSGAGDRLLREYSGGNYRDVSARSETELEYVRFTGHASNDCSGGGTIFHLLADRPAL